MDASNFEALISVALSSLGLREGSELAIDKASVSRAAVRMVLSTETKKRW